MMKLEKTSGSDSFSKFVVLFVFFALAAEEVLTNSKIEPRGNSNGESTGSLPHNT